MIRLKNFYNFQPMNYRIEDPEKFKSKWVIKIEERLDSFSFFF